MSARVWSTFLLRGRGRAGSFAEQQLVIEPNNVKPKRKRMVDMRDNETDYEQRNCKIQATFSKQVFHSSFNHIGQYTPNYMKPAFTVNSD